MEGRSLLEASFFVWMEFIPQISSVFAKNCFTKQGKTDKINGQG
jgi:hypothetical protein